jgi:hypothetical protein
MRWIWEMAKTAKNDRAVVENAPTRPGYFLANYFLVFSGLFFGGGAKLALAGWQVIAFGSPPNKLWREA